MSTLALDLDGTLITAHTRQSYLLRALARAAGYTLPVAAIWQAKQAGASNRALLRALGVPAAAAEQIAALWLRHIETPYWLTLDVVFDDVPATLAALRAAGHRLVLVTARGNAALARQQLLQLGLLELLDEVHVVAPAGAAQHKAAVLRACCAQAMVGDSETDMQAAALAGIAFVAVGRGQRSAPWLAAHGAGTVYASLREAVRALPPFSA